MSGDGRPLDGLRIIDVSTYVAGPSGAMTLAQLGADVIRVDPVGGATDTRRLPLDAKGTSLYWAGLNAAKRSIEVDTGTEDGRALVTQLITAPGPDGGIVLTNAVGQAWLAYERLAAMRADVIVVHILGRGDGKPAVDYTVNCEVGLPLITGPVEVDRPVNHVLPAWDLLTGLQAAIGVLAAERVRTRTGRGEHITVSLADVAVATMAHLGFVADVVLNGHGRLRDGNYLYGSFGNDFATADGHRVMIVALTARHWRRLLALTSIEETVGALERALDVDLSDEPVRYQYREVLSGLLRPWFEQRTYDEVAAALEPSGVLWGPYRSVDEFVHAPDSVLRASDLMAELDQPGIGRYPAPRPVLGLPGRAERPPAPAPILGQHTDEVLGEVLGLDGAALDDLRQRGVIGTAIP